MKLSTSAELSIGSLGSQGKPSACLCAVLITVFLASASPLGASAAQCDDPMFLHSASGSRISHQCTATGPGIPPPPEGPGVTCSATTAEVGFDRCGSNPGADTGPYRTQSETTVAFRPNNPDVICAAWNDTGIPPGYSGFGSSQDGGLTFQDHGAVPAAVNGASDVGDPSLAWSVRDNRFYYAALRAPSGVSPFYGISLWQSTNGCQTFTALSDNIAPSSADPDKELLAIDNNPSSSHYGRFYVGWKDYANYPSLPLSVRVSYSDDGVTWFQSSSLPDQSVGRAQYSLQGMWPAVAPNGDVYFAVLDGADVPLPGLDNHRIYRSTNGGVSFTRVTDIASNVPAAFHQNASDGCYPYAALNGYIRHRSFPQVAIQPLAAPVGAYVLHAVLNYDSDEPSASDISNVFYTRSTNGGASWSTPMRLNGDPTNTDQWNPAIAVNANGVVAVTWYDRRVDTVNNFNYSRFSRISMDGGVTWGADFQIADVVSSVPPLCLLSSGLCISNPSDARVSYCYHGDYDQIAIDEKARTYDLWSDDRLGNPDVYFERVSWNSGFARVVNFSGLWRWAMNDDRLQLTGQASAYPGSDREVTFAGSSVANDKPISGDWDGDGFDSPATLGPGTSCGCAGCMVELRMDDTFDGNHDFSVTLSAFPMTYEPVVGDWNGAKRDGVGAAVAFSGAIVFQLWNSSPSGIDPIYDELTPGIGVDTDKPIVGDWNKDGKTDIGVRRFVNLDGDADYEAIDFILDKGANGRDGADMQTIQVSPGSNARLVSGISGDWNADGIWDVAVIDLPTSGNSVWHLDYSHNGTIDEVQAFGTNDWPRFQSGNWKAQ